MLIELFQTGMNFGLGSAAFKSVLTQFLLSLPVFLFSLAFHEAGHAYAAHRCGDDTAYMLGRMTLNPIKHIDPFGFLLLMTAGFGWAKPVPVNPRNYRRYRRDDFLVSIAGITGNLILMVFGVVALFLLMWYGLRTGAMGAWYGYAYIMLSNLIAVNITLAFFNLLPIPPLDGYHLFNDLFLKRRLFAPAVAQRVGQILLFALLFSGGVNIYLNFIHTHLGNAIDALYRLAFQALA